MRVGQSVLLRDAIAKQLWFTTTYNEGVEKQGASLLIHLRLVPVVPFL